MVGRTLLETFIPAAPDFIRANMGLGIKEPQRSRGGLVPGTSVLIETSDGNNGVTTKHGAGNYSDLILVPQPSDSPNDPLVCSLSCGFAMLTFRRIGLLGRKT